MAEGGAAAIMINYDVDILEVSTGLTRRTPMWVGWTQYSPHIYQNNMCDCNLYGYRERGYVESEERGGWSWHGQSHESVAYNFIARVGCDHSTPPKHYKALLAYLDDGRVYDFTQLRFIVG